MSTKFHIYKVEDNNEIGDLIADIEDVLNENELQYNLVNQDNFHGLIFFSQSIPRWAGTIGQLVNNEILDNVWNRSSSYILFKENDGEIYLICGGNGYRYVQEFIVKDFGLNLVPKLVNDADNVIKKVVDNPYIGNSLQIQKTNKKPTNILGESDFSNVYKELNIQADEAILNEFGLEDVDSARIISKDFISIEKELSLIELCTILDNLNDINQRDSNFSLNPFKSIKQTNFSATDLKDVFIDYIWDKQFELLSFSVVGNDISTYLDNGKYFFSLGEDFILEPNGPVEWIHLENKLNDETFTKKFLKELFFDTMLVTYDSEDNITLQRELFSCLSGSMIIHEDYKSLTQGMEFYLMNGQWYILNQCLNNFYTTRFERLHQDSEEFIVNHVFNLFPCVKTHWRLDFGDENAYNDSFQNIDYVIFAHRRKQKFIEIADLILYDEISNQLLIICVKNHAGATGCRELFGQIESSIYYIKNYFVNNLNNELNKYYKKLDEDNENMPIDEDKFVELFRMGRYSFIASFLNNDAWDNLSNFGKILSFNISNLLHEQGSKLYLLDFRFGENE